MNNVKLADRRCGPVPHGAPPLRSAEAAPLLSQLDSGWKLIEDHHLERTFTFTDFRGALDFANQVGLLAEQEQHHPEITVTWGRTLIRVWTHKIEGLSESDFVLAAKIDRMAGPSDARRAA